MPDWVSHILIALIIGHLFSVRKKSLLVLGSVLPDILGKGKMLNTFFDGINPDLIIWTNYGHSFTGTILVSFFLALFFSYPYFKTAFLIAIGSISHLLADGTFKSFIFSGYLPILWHDQYWVILILTLIIYWLLVKFDIKFSRWRDKNESSVEAG